MASSISAGTTSSTALVATADTTGALQLATNNGTVAVTIDTSQNVGIGTTLPSYKLNVGDTSSVTTLNGAAITLFSSGSLTSNIGGVLNFRPQLGTTASDIFNLSICAYDHSGDTNADGLSINASDGISFCTGSNARNERMRIDSNGYLLVNQTSNATNSYVQIKGAQPALSVESTSTGGVNQIIIKNPNGTVGSISTSGSATAYNTSSDYRLKEDIAPMTGALAKVALLKPCTYKWNVDGSDGQGFIAHELDEVMPGCVTGEKDAVETYTDEDGNEQTRPVYQGIDTSFLVATLTAAIQEQQALITQQAAAIEALTTRITALEGTPA